MLKRSSVGLFLLAGALMVWADDFSQWTYYRNIILNTTATGAGVAADVVKIPVLIRLSSSDSLVFKTSLKNGEDVRFSKSTGTHFPYHIESWDSAGRAAAIWVLVDTIKGTNGTQYIKMYWGKSGAGDSSQQSTVFDPSNGYVAVFHFGGGVNLPNATGNTSYDGVDNGTRDTIVGRIGRARGFNGINQYFSLSSMPERSSGTISCWFKSMHPFNSSKNYNMGIWARKKTDNDDAVLTFRGLAGIYDLGDGNPGCIQTKIEAGGNSAYLAGTTTSFDSVSWYHLSWSWGSSAESMYLNGIMESNTGSSQTVYSDWGDEEIGQAHYDTGNTHNSTVWKFSGILDEFRIENVVRSSDWVKLCYKNQLLTGSGDSLTKPLPAPPTGLTYSQPGPFFYPVGTAITANNAIVTPTGVIIESYTVSPALPTGLSLNSSTGAISGTPTAATNWNTYTFRAQNAGGFVTCNINIAVYLRPTITTQPTSTTVKPNDNALFSLTAIGGTQNTPVAYRWFRNASPIAGAAGASAACTLKAVTITDNGTIVKCAVYYAPAGYPYRDTTWSNLCTLRVMDPPTNLSYSQNPAYYPRGISIAPPNSATVTGTVDSFTISPLLPSGFLWYPVVGAIAGIPADTFSSRKYAVTARNAVGSTVCSLAITVYDRPNITTQPISKTVKAGDTAKFSVVASGTTPSYQWFRGASPIAGATNVTYSPKAQMSDSGAIFKCVVKYVPANDSVISNLCTLNVVEFPAISTQPQSQTVLRGSSVSFSVTATGSPPLTYLWIKNVNDTQGTTSSTITLPSVQKTDDLSRYRCMVKNSAGSIASGTCTLRVVAAGFSAIPAIGIDTLTVRFIDSSTGGVTSHQWNFGDSSALDTTSGPTHFYGAVGKYTVIEKVSVGAIVDSMRIDSCIVVNYSRPIAAFQADTFYATDSLTVHFTDVSKGVITGKKWDFGDGAMDTSKAASVAHTYRDTGFFTVKLIVTGPGGIDTLVQQDYIKVRSKGDYPVFIKASRLSPDSVIISINNFSSIVTSKKVLLPPFADTMGLWFKSGSIPINSSDSILKKYSVVDMQNTGTGPFIDTVPVPVSPPADSVYYGFNTALFWFGAGTPIGAMKPGNGDLVLMRDTVRPANGLIISGKYLDADSCAIYLDNISSLDPFAVDSVGIGYSLNYFANFNDAEHIQWISLPAVIAGASQNRFSTTLHENKLIGDTARIYCAALVVGKNRMRSAANDTVFQAGRLRPQNPIRLSAKAASPTTILLTWKEQGTGNAITGADSIIIWRGTREVPLEFALSSPDFTPLRPLAGDTALLSDGLNAKTRYYYGAQICSRGLWSSVTDSSSAMDSTPAILDTVTPINPVKITSLSYTTVNNNIVIVVKWHVDTLDVDAEIGIAYSLVSYPVDSIHPPTQVVKVQSADGNAIVDMRDSLVFDKPYYVSLWYRKKDGKWALPVSASEATVVIPADLSWQVVKYFVAIPETVSVFGGKLLLANDPGTKEQTTDTLRYWEVPAAGIKGFVPVSNGFYFAQHMPFPPFHIGIKYSLDSIPSGYGIGDIRIYRFIDGKLFAEQNTILDTAQRIAWIFAQNVNYVSYPLIAMVDTVPMTVSVLSHTAVPVLSGKEVVDTFVVVDNCANSAYQFKYGKGDNFPEPHDTGEGHIGNDTILMSINRSYVNQENGVRALFIVSDGPHTVTINVSRQVIRDSTSDVISVLANSWHPLQASAQLDSPGVKWALKDLNIKGKWYYDNSVFRLFRWYAYSDNADNSVKWVEYSDTTDWIFNFDPCRLMWIKTRKPVTLHLGKGVTTSLKRCYTTISAPKTWTDVALPYRFSIRVGDIIDSTNANSANSGGTKGDSLCFYYWQKDTTNQYRCRPKFLANFEKAAPSLANKEDSLSENVAGFTVYNPLKTSVTLSFPPIPTPMSKFRMAKNLGKKTEQSGWAVRIAGKTAGGMILSEVYCGYCDGEPGMTYYPVPMLFSGIGIWVCDSVKRHFGHALARGKWNKESGVTYPLAFSNSSDKSETIDYTVENLQQLPKNVSAAIIDYSTGALDNASRPSPVTLAKGETVYRRLVVGTDEYLKKVKGEMQFYKLALVATCANPFTHTLKIRFSLPYEGVSKMRFSIVDIMGRIVWEQSIPCFRAHGMQEYIWSGRTNSNRPVGAGMYILRMTAFDAKRNSVGSFEKKIPYMP